MLSKLKLAKHQQHLAQLPKLAQSVADVETLYQTSAFRSTLLKYIAQAQNEIFITALYLEHDEAGEEILEALYTAKQQRPELSITVIVDWHRAQRGRIGVSADATNADWYHKVA
ncbi:CDP-diacylglycerol--serine O-phosphatidyltransferase, partial [Providencia manganoxydans]